MANANTVVRVKQGELRGVVAESTYGNQLLAFRGIPYAKPPIGPLRFKDPEPVEPWTGVRDASKFGDECVQIDILTRQLIGTENSLFLNVYRPITDAPKRAVMVWIHGGAFMNGSGNDRFYGPDYLVRKDIVLVTINYRVGILGFLNLEDEIAPGNQGLKDQVMALKWIKENISSFGGDPDNITIFGESAGGASIHYLTISPLSQGLFHKAISQSGVAVNPWAYIRKEPRKYAFQVAAQLGEHSTDPATVLEFFRKVDSKDLVNAEHKLLTPEIRFTAFGLFGPGVDKKSPNPFLPELPSEQMQQGVKVPYMLGFTENEGAALISLMVTPNASKETYAKMNKNFETILHPEMLDCMKQEGITVDEVKRIYFGNEPISEKTLQQHADLLSDVFFVRGIFDVVRIQQEKNLRPTYFYKFTYDSPQSLAKAVFNSTLKGATHADELSYLFYSYLAKEMNIPPPAPGSERYKVMECLTQMWTDFAKTGNPTPKVTDVVTTTWKPIESGNEYNYLNISDTLKMETTSKDDQRFNWKSMKNKL